jgi:hypothetical protein
VTLSNHKLFCISASHLPSSKPDLPQEILQHPTVLAGVHKLAEIIGVSEQFITK